VSAFRIVLLVWLMTLVVACVAGLVFVARERRIADLVDQIRIVDSRSRVDTRALDLVRMECERSELRPEIVVKAWSSLRGKPSSSIARGLLESRIEQDLARVLTEHQPDETRLHRLWEVAAIIDAELAAAVHVRIASRAGDREGAATQVITAADRLEEGLLINDPGELDQAWQRLRLAGSGPHWFTWAARETPPMSMAAEATQQALFTNLDLRVTNPTVEGDPQVTWEVIERCDMVEAIPPGLARRYANVIRIGQLPASALLWCGIFSTALFGSLGWAFHRMMRERRRFDPSAETIENVEPIEFETDGITIQREVTSEETQVD
jgi:hypothetical protein